MFDFDLGPPHVVEHASAGVRTLAELFGRRAVEEQHAETFGAIYTEEGFALEPLD